MSVYKSTSFTVSPLTRRSVSVSHRITLTLTLSNHYLRVTNDVKCMLRSFLLCTTLLFIWECCFGKI